MQNLSLGSEQRPWNSEKVMLPITSSREVKLPLPNQLIIKKTTTYGAPDLSYY